MFPTSWLAWRVLNTALSHWRIAALVALLLAYGFHKHVVAQRDAARFEAQVAARDLATVEAVNQHNADELRRVTDALAAAQARTAVAERALAMRQVATENDASTITREVIRHADPAACPPAPSVRAALDGLRNAGGDAGRRP